MCHAQVNGVAFDVLVRNTSAYDGTAGMNAVDGLSENRVEGTRDKGNFVQINVGVDSDTDFEFCFVKTGTLDEYVTLSKFRCLPAVPSNYRASPV